MSNLEEQIQKLIDSGVTGIEWKAQTAGTSDVLFYRLSGDPTKALKTMKERLSASNYKVVVLNGKPEQAVRDALWVDEKRFLELRTSLADRLYPLTDKKLIAVTGTNGKTTTVDLIRQILVKKNIGVLTVGTLGVYLNENKLEDFGLTSPDYIDLRKSLYANRNNYQVCALEASSHALSQGRLHGLCFSAIGWTSFSQDHLDYHGTMEEYFQAKKELLNYAKTPFLVSARADDLLKKLGGDAQTAGKIKPPANAFFKSAFNQINLDVAVGCLESAGIHVSESELKNLTPPPGRFNTIPNGDQLFVIDFAHTPDALENICGELKRSFPRKKLVCVFGCGGDRDANKRPLMGAAASANSDFVYVTSDNPRYEDPEKIIEDIEPGLARGKYSKITDRYAAIQRAVEEFPDAVILIAGKGHEPYIDEKGVKRPYSDEEALQRIIGI